MKKMTDEELQQWLENNKTMPESELTDEDAKAYMALFNALETEPEAGLPYDFAAKVTRTVQAETKRGNELKRYLLNAFLFLLASCAVIALLALNAHGFNLLLQYKWGIGLCLLAFCIVQGLDERLITSKLFKR